MVDYFPPAAARPVDLDHVVDRLESYSIEEQIAFEGDFLEEAIELTRRLSASEYLLRKFIDEMGSLETAQRHFTPPQTFHLRRTSRIGIRVNVWPKLKNSEIADRERAMFSYDLGHNHDFDFVTVGYLGCGYETDLGRIDPNDTHLPDGAHLHIRDRVRHRLERGSILAFKAYSDAHVQYPPEELSISINLLSLVKKPSQAEQILIDMDKSKIISRITEGDLGRLSTIIELAASFPGEGTADIIARIAGESPRAALREAASSRLKEMAERSGIAA